MRNNYQDSNSSFWLGEDFFEDTTWDVLGEEVVKHKAGKDPVKLAGYRRAISNFVRIVTGEAIPVRFNTSGDSYTDGKTVTISASLKDKDFDSAVGLALHEGSHIKLTDFNTLRDLEDWVKNHDTYMMMLAEKHGAKESEYKNAPGYRGYYEALYDKYFNAKIIDKGLKSDEYTDANWDSFFFRLANITNPNRRFDVLNLDKIWKMLDLKNIARLKNTNDVRDLAFEVFQVIEEQIPSLGLDKKEDFPGQSSEGEMKKGEDGQDGPGGEPKDGNGEHGNINDDGSIAYADDAKKGSDDKHGNVKAKDLEELNNRQKAQLEKAMKKQKQFVNQDTKKTSISKKVQKQMRAMENSGVDYKEVEYERDTYYESKVKRKAEVIVINNFTKDLIANVDCGMWDMPDYAWRIGPRHEWIKEGMRRGVVLGKKLKVRAEERNTKFNRLRSGKIDKRMIANAGWGAEGIFEKIESFAYNPGIIHISIDNSGSMNGSRFQNAVTTAVAVAKACDMIENMDCVISFRAGSYFVSERDHKAVMLIAYDSRKHGMTQIKTLMPHVCVSGSTPEGLCFDAIMKEIISASKGKDSYFVNMSDGAPYYDFYSGEAAWKHTREQVKKMKKEGIKVISYFITGSYSYEGENNAFKVMYGKEAQFIDVNKINDVAKTMNSKFLEIA
jgi:hypothetical protein